MHASKNASRLASIGLAVILLFLCGFALWATATTSSAIDAVKRASVVSDGFRLARYSLALEDLVMTSYLTKPLYDEPVQSPRPPAMPAARAHGRVPRPRTVGGMHRPGPARRMRVPSPHMPRSSAPMPRRSAPMPRSSASMSARPTSGMSTSGTSMGGTSMGGTSMGGTSMGGTSTGGTSMGGAAMGSRGMPADYVPQGPTGVSLRANHDSAAAKLMDAMQSVRLNGDGADRRLANDVLTRHGAHMAAAMRLFDAVDQHNSRLALWIQQHQLGPSFSHIEEEVNAAAASHRNEAIRRLQQLGDTESLVFTGTIVAFTIGLALLGALAALLRSYSRRIDEARKAELARLEEVALTDNLTGLRNHRAFQEDLARLLEQRNRARTELSLVLLDLDRLKQVNDRFGHQKGDEQLTALAAALERTARGSDCAYRIGGDEFAVLMPGESGWAGVRLMDRLNVELAASTMSPTPSATAGIAESVDAASRDILIKHADLALLEAKRSNRPAMVWAEGLARDLPKPDAEAQQHHLTVLTTALARAVDAKDAYTRSHSDTVSELCGLIAAQLGLEPERRAKLRLAGLLHDVGKIGIADEILKKPAKLNAAEFEIMKTHSRLGHTIVSGAELEQEAEWILHHHERLDGRGYPDGLAGDEIPLESRIILVADAFEAMTSDRPYRKGRPEADALAELDAHAGTQFDLRCVEALKRALATKGFEQVGLPSPEPAITVAPDPAGAVAVA